MRFQNKLIFSDTETTGKDPKDFIQIMNKQKEFSRNSNERSSVGESQKLYSSLNLDPTEFTGYETLESQSKIIAIIKDNKIPTKPLGWVSIPVSTLIFAIQIIHPHHQDPHSLLKTFTEPACNDECE